MSSTYQAAEGAHDGGFEGNFRESSCFSTWGCRYRWKEHVNSWLLFGVTFVLYPARLEGRERSQTGGRETPLSYLKTTYATVLYSANLVICLFFFKILQLVVKSDLGSTRKTATKLDLPIKLNP